MNRQAHPKARCVRALRRSDRPSRGSSPPTQVHAADQPATLSRPHGPQEVESGSDGANAAGASEPNDAVSPRALQTHPAITSSLDDVICSTPVLLTRSLSRPHRRAMDALRPHPAQPIAPIPHRFLRCAPRAVAASGGQWHHSGAGRGRDGALTQLAQVLEFGNVPVDEGRLAFKFTGMVAKCLIGELALARRLAALGVQAKRAVLGRLGGTLPSVAASALSLLAS